MRKGCTAPLYWPLASATATTHAVKLRRVLSHLAS